MKREHTPAHILLSALGLHAGSFEDLIEWVLCEHLALSLANEPQIPDTLFTLPDALKQFRNYLRKRTRRTWSKHDLNALFERVKAERTKHFREPTFYEEYLKLLWQVPLECAYCKRKPPEVRLHVDHIVPVSKGGSSRRSNLQFLCQQCNLKKSNKRKAGERWLDLL